MTADLGYHALAVDVVASALMCSVVTKPFGDFRGKLARLDKNALQLAEKLSEALPNGHEKSIAETMLRSVRELGWEGQDFLRLASVLAVAPIPALLVTTVFQEADKISREEAEERASLAFRQVTSASLAEIAGEKRDARTVHTLVSRTVRFQEKGSPERTEAIRTAAIVALRAAIATAAEDPRLHREVELQVAHGRQVVLDPATVSEAALVDCVAQYDLVRGAYASARKLSERVLNFRRRVLGPEHPDTLDTMNNLGVAMSQQGDLAGARKLQEETFEIRRRVLEPKHPDTIRSMGNVARTLFDQGNLAGARKLQEKTLDMHLRVLGPLHPDTVTSMSNLAVTLFAIGDVAGAHKLQEDTLEIRRRVLGPEHPDTLASMNNLAWTLLAQGNLAGARRLQEATLEIVRRVLGPEHPNTLTSMNNLSETLRALGDLPRARKLQEETLEILRRSLGSEHPNTLRAMGNLAGTFYAQGDFEAARKLEEQTLDISRRVLGPEHPDTSTFAWNLFRTLQDSSEYAAGQAVLKRNLFWLLDRDPATLGTDQRAIRENLAPAIKKGRLR